MRISQLMGTLGSALCVVFLTVEAGYPASPCEDLTEAQRKAANRVMSEFYLYDCCDQTLQECLSQQPRCRLAVRLRDEVCRRVYHEQARQTVKKALYDRRESMDPGGRQYGIDTSGLNAWLGDPKSKVILAGYLDSRCPYCAQITRELHREITEGKLKEKVAFYVRPFPLKIHPHGVEAAVAAVAAGKLGAFWPFLMTEYRQFDDYDGGKLAAWAKEVGLDEKEFNRLAEDKATKNLVVESKKEGIANGVTETPTFFINGRKYTADISAEYLIDALEEEYERVTGKKYE